jgi:hypothetical protein
MLKRPVTKKGTVPMATSDAWLKNTLAENFSDMHARLGNIETALNETPTKADLDTAVKKILDRLPPKP